jgi:hypothetical protein
MAGCAEHQPDFDALISCSAPVHDHLESGERAAHKHLRIESVLPRESRDRSRPGTGSAGCTGRIAVSAPCAQGHFESTRQRSEAVDVEDVEGLADLPVLLLLGEELSDKRALEQRGSAKPRRVLREQRTRSRSASPVARPKASAALLVADKLASLSPTSWRPCPRRGANDKLASLPPPRSEVDALRSLRPAIFGAARRCHTVASVRTPGRAKISSAITDLYFAEELKACWQAAAQRMSTLTPAQGPDNSEPRCDVLKRHHDAMPSANIFTAICQPGGAGVQGSRLSARHLALDLDISAQWVLFTDTAHVLLDQELSEGMDGSALLASASKQRRSMPRCQLAPCHDLASTPAQGSDSL